MAGPRLGHSPRTMRGPSREGECWGVWVNWSCCASRNELSLVSDWPGDLRALRRVPKARQVARARRGECIMPRGAMLGRQGI